MYSPIKAAIEEYSNSIFYHPTMAKFINLMMRQGKKSEATDKVYRALYSVKKMKNPRGLTPIDTFELAIKNASPVLEMTSIERGGTVYDVRGPFSVYRRCMHISCYCVPP